MAHVGHDIAASMQDTLPEGTARAAQLAPSAVTASAVGGSARDPPPEVWLPTLSDDERLLYAARSRVLLDEPSTSLMTNASSAAA